MSRATAMASRAREAQISPSGGPPDRGSGEAKRSVAWKVAAILAGAGVLFWIFSPGSSEPRRDPRPPDPPRLPDLRDRCDQCGRSDPAAGADLQIDGSRSEES